MPLERVLVPLDGSATAEAALPEIRRLLRGRGETELLLFQAVASPDGAGAARDYLRRIEDGLAADGLRARPIVYDGPAADAIVLAAEREGADLIALATHGRGGLARAVLGSVTERVLRKAGVPVFAVRTAPGAPARRGGAGMRDILLPLDGSEHALRAFPAAVDMARLFRARLLVLWVLDAARDRARAEAHLARVETLAREEGVPLLSLVEEGDPVDEILDVARFHEVDLIVMSTHGRRGLERLVTGSVTEGVLRKSPVPLVVVRSL